MWNSIIQRKLVFKIIAALALLINQSCIGEYPECCYMSIDRYQAMAFDSKNQELLVLRNSLSEISGAVRATDSTLEANDIYTGEYRKLASVDASNIISLAVDTRRNQALILDEILGLLGIDLTTGQQTVISSEADITDRAVMQNRYLPDIENSLVYDATLDRALMYVGGVNVNGGFNGVNLVSIDLTTGQRQVFAGPWTGAPGSLSITDQHLFLSLTNYEPELRVHLYRIDIATALVTELPLPPEINQALSYRFIAMPDQQGLVLFQRKKDHLNSILGGISIESYGTLSFYDLNDNSLTRKFPQYEQAVLTIDGMTQDRYGIPIKSIISGELVYVGNGSIFAKSRSHFGQKNVFQIHSNIVRMENFSNWQLHDQSNFQNILKSAPSPVDEAFANFIEVLLTPIYLIILRLA